MNAHFSESSTQDDLQKQTNQTSENPAGAPSPLSKSQEEIRLIGIIHLAINIFSAATFGVVFALLYLLLKKDQLDPIVKAELVEILNFNISFYLYWMITGALFFVLIGFLIAPLLFIFHIILLIIGAVKHINGESYRYPGIIRLIKNF